MEVNDLVSLWDARLRGATTQADVATKLATLPIDLALRAEGVTAARIANVARWLDVQWDGAAHRRLVSAVNEAKARARHVEQEAKRARTHAQRLGVLLAGTGSWTSVRDAWVAHTYFMSHIGVDIIAKAMEVWHGEMTSTEQWRHPGALGGEGEVDHKCEAHDVGGVLDWARRNTYHPRTGTVAWRAVATHLEALAKGAAAEAARLDAETEATVKDLRALLETDWKRLDDEEKT